MEATIDDSIILRKKGVEERQFHLKKIGNISSNGKTSLTVSI